MVNLNESENSVRGVAARLEGLLSEDSPEVSEEQPEEEAVAEAEAEDNQAEPEEEAEDDTDDGQDDEAEDEGEDESEAEEEAEPVEEPKYKVKVQGEELEVTLEDLQKGYMQEADYRKKTAELSEQRQAFESQRTEQMQVLQNQMQQAEGLVSAFEQQLLAEYQATDWQALRTNDPAEFAARQQEFRVKADRIDAAKANIVRNYQENQQRMEYESQKARQEYLVEQNSLLEKAIPEWKVPEKRAEIQKEMTSYLSDFGLSSEEISTISDHRILLMARKAMAYDKLEKSKPGVEKKVRNAPKVQKPGTRQTKAELNADQFEKNRKRLKATGRVEDAAELLKHIL